MFYSRLEKLHLRREEGIPPKRFYLLQNIIQSDEHRSYTGSSSPMSRQYPHRAGRIRVNRQFSTIERQYGGE